MTTTVLSKRIKRKLREIPSICGSFIITAPVIEDRLKIAYDKAKETHRPVLPHLSAQDCEIVAAIEKDGVYQTSVADLDLPGTNEMLSSGRRLAEDYERMHKNGALDDLDAFQASDTDVMRNAHIFYWGLNERLLNIAENYLGLPVAFDGINIFYTKSDGRQVAARKWHLDGEDRRMLKIAVYLNDVSPDGGPLQILTRDVPANTFLARARPPVFTHEMLENQFTAAPLKDADITTCTGPIGTVIFCDTARKYHRGKPAVAQDRCAVFYNYFSRPPLRPFYCERSTLSRTQIKTLAEGLSPRQRDALLWHNSLPLVARLFPPAPIA